MIVLYLLFLLPAFLYPPGALNVFTMFCLWIGSKYCVKKYGYILKRIVILQEKFTYISWFILLFVVLGVSYIIPLLILNFWFPNIVSNDYWKCYFIYFSMFFVINLLFQIIVFLTKKFPKEIAYKIVALFLFLCNIVIYYITLAL